MIPNQRPKSEFNELNNRTEIIIFFFVTFLSALFWEKICSFYGIVLITD